MQQSLNTANPKTAFVVSYRKASSGTNCSSRHNAVFWNLCLWLKAVAVAASQWIWTVQWGVTAGALSLKQGYGCFSPDFWFDSDGRLIFLFPCLYSSLNTLPPKILRHQGKDQRKVLLWYWGDEGHGLTSVAGSGLVGAETAGGWASVENQEDMADLALVNAPPTDWPTAFPVCTMLRLVVIMAFPIFFPRSLFCTECESRSFTSATLYCPWNGWPGVIRAMAGCLLLYHTR